ncbi:MAG: GNAT family N-acetyltransferase [Candidatus Paceibacterota bacterium]|jgi:GNAT superfamily N-acetyltransferase|nr:GNAT family N-acetyltransferase [Candidatus Paceibacterota bacterium]
MSKANQTIIEKDISEDLIKEIAKMESEVFHESLAWEEQEMHKALHHPSAINILSYDEEERIAGYLMTIDLAEEIDELREADPDIEQIPGALYLNNVVVRPDMQGKGYFGKLLKKFLETFPDRTVVLHANTKNNSSVGFQKYGAKFIRKIDNWYGTGEPFDYLMFEPKK